jgi:predicted DNA-binding protein
MLRTQIQLEESQYQKLKALAVKRSRSISQLVRESVEQYLNMAERRDKWSRLWEAVGHCHEKEEGARDVARRHDDYLTGVYRR